MPAATLAQASVLARTRFSDDEAIRQYRDRLAYLDTEITEAEAWNDSERAAEARDQRDFLTAELSKAVGLGGRSRPTTDAAERARVNVTKAVRAAIAKIGEAAPVLGHHLDRSIKTGSFCSYRPDPSSTIDWDMSGDRYER